MKIEDIKTEETYNVRVRVEKLEKEYFECSTIAPNGKRIYTCFFYLKDAAAFSPATNDFKYNPWRMFKKGDKVRVVDRYGRTPVRFPNGKIMVGDIVTIAEDEDCNLFMDVFVKDGEKIAVPWFFLELVTPVEEYKPYSVFINAPGKACEVRKDNKTTATFYYGSASAYTEDEAEALAQAECDRLNEHRKEN